MPARKATRSAAKKARGKGATQAVKKTAKKAGAKVAKKVVRPPKSHSPGAKACPPVPFDFFSEVQTWTNDMTTWAQEVDTCYKATCGTPARRLKMLALCAAFAVWARQMKKFADDVEVCFQAPPCNGGGPPGHTVPPKPPF